MRYTLTGACPKCGAPIYETRTAEDFTDAPGAHFTCECRKSMPAPLPEEDIPEGDSVDEADRKHMARKRPGQEEASAERVE